MNIVIGATIDNLNSWLLAMMYYEAAMIAPFIYNREKVPKRKKWIFKTVFYGMIVYVLAVMAVGIYITFTADCEINTP